MSAILDALTAALTEPSHKIRPLPSPLYHLSVILPVAVGGGTPHNPAYVNYPPCRAINRTFADPRTVPVTNLRPDHNEGEPFRLRLPFFLKLVLGVPAQLGVVEFALAPKGESVFRFSGPRARTPVFEGPWAEVTHLRRTSLGATWLDPLGPPPRDAAGGPGADGLDALADLLG